MNRIKGYTQNFALLVIYLIMLPVILYRRVRHGRSLGNFSQRFFGKVPNLADSDHSVGHRIWLHAVSVGEVNLLTPIIDRLQRRYPSCQIAISTTTATGMQLAQQKFSQHTLFYFPIDFTWAMSKALDRLQPSLLVLVELELWPTLIRKAHSRCIPIAVVNGRLSESSFQGYRRLRRLLKRTFSRLDLVAAQTEDYAVRFGAMGCPAERVHAVGSIKFDNATAEVDAKLLNELRQSIALKDDDVLFVAGSTQIPEERYAATVWSELRNRFPELRLVVVPRHPHNGPEIKLQLADLGIASRLRSSGQQTVVTRNEILIADTIGELTGWWALSSIAFVGGSFGKRGGQNMIEPAACGAAVCFGPNTKNFRKVVESMLANKIATVVHDPHELRTFVEHCLSDPINAKRTCAKAQQFVASQAGAIDRTMELLEEQLPRMSAQSEALVQQSRIA